MTLARFGNPLLHHLAPRVKTEDTVCDLVQERPHGTTARAEKPSSGYLEVRIRRECEGWGLAIYTDGRCAPSPVQWGVAAFFTPLLSHQPGRLHNRSFRRGSASKRVPR